MQRTGILGSETGTFAAIDGDSLRRDAGELRLRGIDAPELNQICSNRMGGDYACGRESRSALARLIGNREIDCVVHETDRYGRGVATCHVGKVSINAEMVRLGWALAYRRHALSYLSEEAEARLAARGLWQGEFDEPEDWRNANRATLTGADLSD
jgi:endonuclease YncB( thermonuclease family)